jgi:hypothetical protein
MDFSVMNRRMNKADDKELDLCCKITEDSSFDTHPDFKVRRIPNVQVIYQTFNQNLVNVASIFVILGCSIHSRSLHHDSDRKKYSNICK